MTFDFDISWPFGGLHFRREAVDREAAEMLAKYKARKHRDAKCTVTEVPAQPEAVESGKLPIPEGPSLEHAFAPGSPEYFEQVEGEARAVVREAKPMTWGPL